eukprot:748421-Hanusia_phi.AAC.1
MQASESPVLAVRSLSSSEILSQGKDGLLNVWDVEYSASASHRKADNSIRGEQHTFCKCEIVRDGNLTAQLVVFAQGRDEIALWDLRGQQPVSVLKPSQGSKQETGFCTALAALNERHVIGGYEDGGVRLFDVRKNFAVLQERLHAEAVFGLDAVRTGSEKSAGRGFAVMSGSANGELVLSRLSASSAEQQMLMSEKGRIQLKVKEEGRGARARER